MTVAIADEVVAFGLGIRDLPCQPWPMPQPPADRRLATVRWQAVSAPVPGDPDGWFAGDVEHVSVGWGGFADYLVTRGPHGSVAVTVDEITVSDAVNAFLFSVLPLALPLFGLEPFHGSAVGVDDEAVLLLGDRGDGKSSTAAALDALGFSILTDDTCAIDGNGFLWPGPPLISPRDEDVPQRVVGAYNKKLLRAPGSIVEGSPRKVVGAFLLKPGNGVHLRVVELGAGEAFPEVIAQSRYPLLLADLRRELQFTLAAHLSGLGVMTVEYDPSRHTFPEVAGLVVASLGSS